MLRGKKERSKCVNAGGKEGGGDTVKALTHVHSQFIRGGRWIIAALRTSSKFIQLHTASESELNLAVCGAPKVLECVP